MLSSRRDIDIEIIPVMNGTYILIPSADVNIFIYIFLETRDSRRICYINLF